MYISNDFIYIFIKSYFVQGSKKGKANSATRRGGSCGCETSRLPNCLNNLLTDGSGVVKLKRRPHITPRKIPGSHFC
jgi:hypothetical protein